MPVERIVLGGPGSAIPGLVAADGGKPRHRRSPVARPPALAGFDEAAARA